MKETEKQRDELQEKVIGLLQEMGTEELNWVHNFIKGILE